MFNKIKYFTLAKKIFDRKYWDDLRRKSLQNKPLKRTKLKSKPMKKKYYPKKNKIGGLYEFYCEEMETFNWICEECGKNVYSSDEIFRLAVMAHLLPKNIFRSIAKHKQNLMCLGGECGCHKKYDKSWESAQGMRVWRNVEYIIVTVLIPLLPEQEYKKLPDFLKQLYERNSNQ